MILCALPYPPLPVKVGKVAEDALVVEGETVTTTHALLAQCMNACVMKGDSAMNQERQERQKRVLQEFLFKLAQVGFLLNGEELYRFYCEFSYKHLATYFKEGEPLDVQFLPLEYISVGDKVHKKMVEYFDGQSILFREERDVSKSGAIDILLLCRERIGRAE